MQPSESSTSMQSCRSIRAISLPADRAPGARPTQNGAGRGGKAMTSAAWAVMSHPSTQSCITHKRCTY